MTKEGTRREKLFLFCSVVALVLGLRYSELCAEGVRYGIELSLNKLIPSLFPFMVIAEIILSTNACHILSRLFAKPFFRVFKISGEGALPFLLGMLFGFPIGIKSAITLYESGKIDESELCRLSLFTSIPSPAFFISAVGEGLFGSARLGALIYLIALLGSVLIGVLCRSAFADLKGVYCATKKQSLRASGVSLASAVTSSATSLISISAFVVFFSMVSEVLKHFLDLLPLSKVLEVCLLGSLEMTGGAALASTLGANGAPLAAAILGFSGISVLCQLVSICKGHNLPIIPYIFSKLFLAGIEFLLALAATRLFPSLLNITSPSAPSFLLYREGGVSCALLAFFVCACFGALLERKRIFFGKTIYKR